MIGHDMRAPVTEPVRSTRHRVDAVGWTEVVLVAALVALALVAGLICTFAVAVMPNLASADDRVFVATMQRFDQNPVFPLTFTAALVLIALGALLQLRHGPAVAVRWTIAVLVLYAVVFAVTVGIHIPLNNEIDETDLDRLADLADVRDRTEGPWAAWNIVRAVLSTAAVVALARVLLLHGRQPTATQPPATQRIRGASPAGDSVRRAPDQEVDSHARTART